MEIRLGNTRYTLTTDGIRSVKDTPYYTVEKEEAFPRPVSAVLGFFAGLLHSTTKIKD